MAIYHLALWLVGVFVTLGSGCASSPALTQKIHQDPQWIVQLQKFPGIHQGKGFDHPASVPLATLTRILSGLSMQYPKSSDKTYQVFSDHASQTLARFLVDGLQTAGKDEVVTFVWTIPASSWQERVTSGGVYVVGDEIHVVLANFNVKQEIWQDAETYEAPVYADPLTPLTAQAGKLMFQPADKMRQVTESEFGGLWSKPWHIAVVLPLESQ